MPNCPPETEGMAVLNVEKKMKQYEFEVLANGTLFIHDKKMKEWKEPKDYCIGIFKQNNESPPEMNIRRRAAIYVTLFVIGAVFLVTTLVVHALLPNMRRAVRGLSLMAHCACMLAAHITLAVAQLIGANVTDVPCQIIAYLCQFTLLSGFFWLNVICLDIGSAFSSFKSMMARSNDLDFTAVLRTFLWYCIYAFGVPFILMVVTIGVDHSDLDHTNTFKPNIGLTACWFENGTVQKCIDMMTKKRK
ncbi:hypothetical protein B566_EDAN007317 [Ephemera danica]|nr:hypothetical protein B566_EDAN007317 [Ephemera danica]